MSTADALLQAVIQRLESATQRLETLARTGAVGTITPASTPSAAAALSAGAPAAPAAPAAAAVPPALAAFDELTATHLAPYVAHSTTLGGLVKDQAEHFAQAIQAQRRLIEIATQSKKPDTPVLQDLIKPLQLAIGKITELKEKNRPSPLFFHLSTVADGVPALGWVVMTVPPPAPYVNELKEAAQFYANRVIRDNKEKGAIHGEWAASYVTFLTELHAYVKAHHTTGLAWNPRGGDAKTVAASAGASAAPAPAPAAGGAPPPPPLPTAAQLEALSGGASGKPAGSAALLGAINSGNVTAGLRKVDASQMTHKNPELRAGSVVSAAALAPKAAATAPAAAPAAAAAAVRPPKIALEGNKWVVENFDGKTDVVVEVKEIRQTVYIYNCKNSTIQVKGKANAITVDKCTKTGVLVENAMSMVDIVNCKSVQLQVTGTAPTVNIDKTDGFQLYLSKESIATQILSAKCSEVNILIQRADGEFDERPLAEQFKTVIQGDKLITQAVEHSG
ncbi:adenylate cyclase associated N terminal-domain-containing protein [Entophlyctis helioformis]|nr:adenylate cyclase associated N terminal-domain-containing protein [Entophlyctis helioformis]